MATPETKDTFELKALKYTLAASIFIHIGTIFLPFLVSLFKSGPTIDLSKELVIDVHIETEGTIKAPEIKVQKQTLPQLPKRFKIKDAQKEAATDEMALVEKTEELKLKAQKEKAIKELTKKEAIARLLREKARKQKNFKKAQNQKIKDFIFAQRKKLGLYKIEGSKGYGSKIRKWILQFYQIPKVLDLEGQNIQAIVSMKITAKGAIEQLKLESSSSSQEFDQIALKTIKDAAPFPKPPSDWVNRTISLPFSINPN